MKEKTFTRGIITTTVKVLNPAKPITTHVKAVKATKTREAVEAHDIVTFEEIESYNVDGKTSVEKESKKYYKKTKSTCFTIELEEVSELREITKSLFMEHSTVVEPKKTEDETKEI